MNGLCRQSRKTGVDDAPDAARPVDATIAPDGCEVVAELMAALADPKRIALLGLLREGEMHGLRLAEELDVTPRNISHHLAVLYRAGVLGRRRDGRQVFYGICDWTALWLVDQAKRALSDSSTEP